MQNWGMRVTCSLPELQLHLPEASLPARQRVKHNLHRLTRPRMTQKMPPRVWMIQRAQMRPRIPKGLAMRSAGGAYHTLSSAAQVIWMGVAIYVWVHMGPQAARVRSWVRRVADASHDDHISLHKYPQ